ncbi:MULTISPECIES: hypothetical protein [Pseudomonas]|uniref:hypothetical protein n=1 Tax=Pseudomonas TaxID=286 RepID=UPI000CEEB0B5|nr:MULTISPECIES: hypothetical protein [Pseudomonas]MBG8559181.1 hypothetical protein [Pseudomonas qingdaonensis]PPS62668.1 hypothetical protein CR917_17520 [Pseudomonas sp. BRM28]
MSNDTGGPAFPVSYDHDTFQPSHVDEAKQLMSGMTLLDYFAAKALVGLLSWPGDEGSGSYHSNSDPAHTASMAYEYGKAMLAARVKP